MSYREPCPKQYTTEDFFGVGQGPIDAIERRTREICEWEREHSAPKLPEGYRVEKHPSYGWECLVGPDGLTIAKDKGDGFNLSGGHNSPEDAKALAAFLGGAR
ncbi:MAG: hypothetical protein CL510_10195 [Actinobacteria bacterium]|jgi:hypothetical protein|nr:hypothetical protein [Actinomycetota bacterium]|tara:strand:+ start:7757 stop:8065 length:309 start_codon:yes stop_codon:yes gene_type:complete